MKVWTDFVDNQEKKLGKAAIDQWLRPLKVVHFDSANLYLEAKDSFQLMWFEEHIRPLLKTSLFNNNYRPIKVHLSISEEKSEGSALKSKKGKPQTFLPTLQLTQDPLDPSMTLENFIIGEKNAVIFRFFQELLDSLGSFNPIYLWGSSGCGKTHLFMALTQALKSRGVKALYTKASTFTEHVVSAIRSSEMQTFRKAYRNSDVLIVDDVHLFARKNATQEEFFHTFNALHTTGRQIILSANCPPKELEEIEPRLISRFEWGINLHLHSLEKNELCKILDLRLKALDFPLALPIKEFLTTHFSTSQSLQRALEALILRCHLEKEIRYQNNSELLTLDVATRMLSDLLKEEETTVLSPEKIVSAVSTYYAISKEDLLGKSQAQEFSLPRHLTMYLCREKLHLPFMKIGKIFNRDHSTVMTSIRLIQKKLEDSDKELALALAEIQKKI